MTNVIPFGSAPGENAMRMPVAFSNAISLELSEIERLVWVSGQLAFNAADRFVASGVRVQTEQCLVNIRSALEQLGGSLADVVQLTVFVRDMVDLEGIHEVRLRYFKEPFPTSTLVAVSGFVHPEALIEINAVAALRRKKQPR